MRHALAVPDEGQNKEEEDSNDRFASVLIAFAQTIVQSDSQSPGNLLLVRGIKTARIPRW